MPRRRLGERRRDARAERRRRRWRARRSASRRTPTQRVQRAAGAARPATPTPRAGTAVGRISSASGVGPRRSRARELAGHVRGSSRGVAGGEQAERDAGDRRVDAGLEHREPDADAERRRRPAMRQTRRTRRTTRSRRRSADARSRATPSVEVVGVEDRDHEDRADVVDDGERQQEDLEPPTAPARPSSASTPTREGDVGRHRDAPARRARRRPALTAR